MHSKIYRLKYLICWSQIGNTVDSEPVNGNLWPSNGNWYMEVFKCIAVISILLYFLIKKENYFYSINRVCCFRMRKLLPVFDSAQSEKALHTLYFDIYVSYYDHWLDTSAGELLVPGCIILPVVSVSITGWTPLLVNY